MLALLEEGLTYEQIGARLGVHPGVAYLVTTGLPADGSDAPSASAHERQGFLPTSQHLSNPALAQNPTTSASVAEWISRRVAADEPMRRAAAARTPYPGDVRTGDEPADVVDVLTRGHNRVNALLKQLAAIPGAKKGGTPAQLAARRSIVDLVIEELTRHEAAEQQLLWPRVRTLLPEGNERADAGVEQERQGERVLEALRPLSGTEEEFDDLVEQLSADSRKHVAFEELVFLELRERMSREELIAWGAEISVEVHAEATSAGAEQEGA